MSHIIKSLAVGASVHDGRFLAVILKFKMANNETLLTSWAKEPVIILLQVLTDYMSYLGQKGIPLNGDSIGSVVREHTPPISQAEIENAPANSVVTKITGYIDKQNNMTLEVQFHKSINATQIVITPEYSEWIVGYVANTLNEFDESGSPIIPTGPMH